MSPKKSVLAVFLLCVYGISLVHSFVPHCHHFLGAIVENHTHVIDYDHQEKGDNTHVDFSHNGHVDGGIFHLLVCLLSETSHADSEENLASFVNVKESLKKMADEAAKPAISPAGLRLPDVLALSLPFQSAPDGLLYIPDPPSAARPYRGPPQLSC